MHESSLPFRSFGSDNNSGVHPRVMKAINEANLNHAVGYGDDPWTHRAEASIRAVFENTGQCYLVFNGTGANTVAIQACTSSYHGIIVSDAAHILTDECGAPFKFSGTTPLVVPGVAGKLHLEQIRPLLEASGGVHHVQPKVIYLSQSTELGTVYQPEEIMALTRFAHEQDMYVVMDGARLCNACAYLGKTLKELTLDVGVDLLSFGGTKNGMLQGECIVNFRPELDQRLAFYRKQSAQLASKMRYLAAQFPEFFAEELYLQNALNANRMAKLLADSCQALGYTAVYPVESNAVFLELSKCKLDYLQSIFFFYIWDRSRNIIRLVCSWDTCVEDIERFIHHLKK